VDNSEVINNCEYPVDNSIGGGGGGELRRFLLEPTKFTKK
jgi:hypothetical protein